MIKIDLYKHLDAAFGKMDLEIKCSIESGQLLTLYGKSGVGKTSILRMLAGLMKPDKGSIMVNEDYWFDHSKKINLRPQKRAVGLVFQDYALFPNMTVRENLEFALEKNQSKENISELIELIELEALQNRKPTTLSGGQKQRVALARALVQRPKLLLLDEPLSALDIEMRTKLQQYILKVHQEMELTTILVSHDLPEILRMSDQVILLEDGKIEKQGAPVDVFNLRENFDALQFTGELISIETSADQYLLKVLVGKDLLKLPGTKEMVEKLKLGDKVQVSSTLVNPIIKKIN